MHDKYDLWKINSSVEFALKETYGDFRTVFENYASDNTTKLKKVEFKKALIEEIL